MPCTMSCKKERPAGNRLPALVLRILGSAMLFMLLTCPAVAGADHNPFSGDAKAAQAGEFEFRINCAFCHGLGARGGGRGPDLTRARKRHGTSDSDLFQNISNGIAGTAMPANGTNGQGVGMTEEEIWQIITYLRSIQVKAPAEPIGNAIHGKQLFYGDANCSHCHMIEGKGGRLGPDLTNAGTARTIDSLIESVRAPSQKLAWGLTEPTKEFAQEYETVTVVLPDGKQITGVTLNEDNFSVQIMDAAERIHLLDKTRLRSIKKSRNSLMPAYDSNSLSDQDLRDIIAFLLDAGTK